MKRRAFSIALIVLSLLLPACGLAEGIGESSAFLERFTANKMGTDGAAWTEEKGNVLVYPLKNGGQVSVTQEEGQILCVAAVLAKDGGVTEEEILSCLLNALEMNEGQVKTGILRDETRISVYLCREADATRLCWQPLLGGTERHASPECGGMNGPRLTTEAAAEAQGFARCRNCWRGEKAILP